MQAPPNVRLWHADSSWTTEKVMQAYFKELKDALELHSDVFQPILFLDAASSHWGATTLRAAAAHGIWVVIIPGGTTWLLQPCDVYVFQQMKRFVREKLQMLREVSPRGMVPVSTWMRVVVASFRRVLQSTAWASAFNNLGLSGTQTNVGGRVLGHVGHESISSTLVGFATSLEECFRLCLPSGKTTPWHLFLRAVPKTTVSRFPQLLSARAISASSTAPTTAWRPPDRPEWHRRLRPRVARATAAEQQHDAVAVRMVDSLSLLRP